MLITFRAKRVKSWSERKKFGSKTKELYTVSYDS